MKERLFDPQLIYLYLARNGFFYQRCGRHVHQAGADALYMVEREMRRGAKCSCLECSWEERKGGDAGRERKQM